MALEALPKSSPEVDPLSMFRAGAGTLDMSKIAATPMLPIRIEPDAEPSRGLFERFMLPVKAIAREGVARPLDSIVTLTEMASATGRRYFGMANSSFPTPGMGLSGLMRQSDFDQVHSWFDNLTTGDGWLAPPIETQAQTFENYSDIDWWLDSAGGAVGNIGAIFAGGGLASAGVKATLGISSRAASTTGMILAGFAMETGATYRQMRQDLLSRGLSEADAAEAASYGAVGYGIVAGLLETYGMKALEPVLKGTGGLKSLLRNTLGAAVSEGGTEGMQAAAEILSRDLTNRIATNQFRPSEFLTMGGKPALAFNQFGQLFDILGNLGSESSLYQIAAESTAGAMGGTGVSLVAGIGASSRRAAENATIAQLSLMSVSDFAQLRAEIEKRMESAKGDEKAALESLILSLDESRADDGADPKITTLASDVAESMGGLSRVLGQIAEEMDAAGDSMSANLNTRQMVKGLAIAAEMLSKGIRSFDSFVAQASVRVPENEDTRDRLRAFVRKILKSENPVATIGALQKTLDQLMDSGEKFTPDQVLSAAKVSIQTTESATTDDINSAMASGIRSLLAGVSELAASKSLAEAEKAKTKLRQTQERLARTKEEHREAIAEVRRLAKEKAEIRQEVADEMLAEQLKRAKSKSEAARVRAMEFIAKEKLRRQEALESQRAIAKAREEELRAKIREERERSRAEHRAAVDDAKLAQARERKVRLQIIRLVESFIPQKYHGPIFRAIAKIGQLGEKKVGTAEEGPVSEINQQAINAVDKLIRRAITDMAVQQAVSARKKLKKSLGSVSKGHGQTGVTPVFLRVAEAIRDKNASGLKAALASLFGTLVERGVSEAGEKQRRDYAEAVEKYASAISAWKGASSQHRKDMAQWKKGGKIGRPPAAPGPKPVPPPRPAPLGVSMFELPNGAFQPWLDISIDDARLADLMLKSSKELRRGKISIEDLLDFSLAMNFFAGSSIDAIAKAREKVAADISEEVGTLIAEVDAHAKKTKKRAKYDRHFRERQSVFPKAFRALISPEGIGNMFLASRRVFGSASSFMSTTAGADGDGGVMIALIRGVSGRNGAMKRTKDAFKYAMDAAGIPMGSAQHARSSQVAVGNRLLTRVASRALTKVGAKAIAPIIESDHHRFTASFTKENEDGTADTQTADVDATLFEYAGLYMSLIDPTTASLIAAGAPVRFGSRLEIPEAQFRMDEDSIAEFKAWIEKNHPAAVTIAAIIQRYTADATFDLINTYSQKFNGTVLMHNPTYVPRRRGRDPGDVEISAEDFDFSNAGHRDRYLTDSGILKARTKDIKRPIIIDDITIMSNNAVWQAASMAHIAMPMAKFASLMRDPYFNSLMNRYHSAQMIDFFKTFERIINQEVVGRPGGRTRWERTLADLIRLFQTSKLAFRVTTAIQAPISILSAGVEMGQRYALAGLKNAYSDDVEEAIRRSPSLAARAKLDDIASHIFEGGAGQSASGMVAEWAGRADAWKDPTTYLDPDMIASRGLWLLRRGDALTIRAIIGGNVIKYAGQRKQMGDYAFFQKVIMESTLTIAKTQPTTDAIYASGFAMVARDSPLFRILFLFRSQVFKNWNMVFERWIDFSESSSGQERLVAGKRLVSSFTWAVFSQALLMNLIKYGWRVLKGSDTSGDDDEWLKGESGRIIAMTIGDSADFAPIIKPIALQIMRSIGTNTGMIDVGLPDLFGDMSLAISEGWKTFSPPDDVDYFDKDWWVTAMRWGRSMDSTMGTGLSTIIDDIYQIAHKMVTGKGVKSGGRSKRPRDASVGLR